MAIDISDWLVHDERDGFEIYATTTPFVVASNALVNATVHHKPHSTLTTTVLNFEITALEMKSPTQTQVVMKSTAVGSYVTVLFNDVIFVAKQRIVNSY